MTFIQELITNHPNVSRRQLSQKLCEAWHWVQPNGQLRDMVCRGMMLDGPGKGTATGVFLLVVSVSAPGSPKPLHRLVTWVSEGKHPVHRVSESVTDIALGASIASGLSSSGEDVPSVVC